MKRFSFPLLVALFLFVAVACSFTSAVYAANPPLNTPPIRDSAGNLVPGIAPDGVTVIPANPAVQSDGILVPDVFGSTSNWNLTPPLRKFVDSLAPLGCGSTNNLGQCIPIAVPDKLTFPGSDYYEIELRRYTEKVHTDLPNATTFQGYVQVNNGTNAAGNSNTVAPAAIHYLGPLILTQKGRAVRIKFVNKLPLESVSPFYLPVDKTVMGAGMGPRNANGTNCDPVWDPRGRGLPTTEPNCANYTTNRAELHLHGGLSPWISDGTPHQWITPAGETTPYKKADNVQYVPDMWFDGSGNVVPAGTPGASINPGDGAQTYYYTNEQSARLMFYHDHSFGITRLNVYAGEAAGYMIQDPTELDLITRGVIPADQIPLVIQDKAFVDPTTIGTLDPTWAWGTGAALPIKWIDATGGTISACPDGQLTCGVAGARKVAGKAPKAGDLWWPHVYMPAENPSSLGGVNPMGRWVYGLYFWPPTTGIKFLPVTNPYYDLDLGTTPWEPPTMPAPPNPSWVAEAFVDTPMINGTVYPKLDVQPKSYRLRILNAAHDRSFNLQLYIADGSVNPNIVNAAACAALGGCATNTEVKMVPAVRYPAFPLWDAPADQRTGGVPDPATSGPAWIQIGNEGGFLPAPTVIPSQPISFVMDPTLFNVGNVNDGSLIMGPAERADVIIDFSQYAGKTLILYNDAPAAMPAFVPNNDYFTDAPDTSGTGGHPGPKAGIGPNTRTLMQINVAAATPAPAFDLNKLMTEFTTTPTQDSVFKKSQHPTLVGQSAYDTAYNLVFPSTAPFWGLVNIGDQNISFATLNPTTLAPEIVNSYPMQPKALHDEMGAVWDEYGRMSAKLGVELPNTNNINQIFVMQNYVDPPTENMQDGKVQIWKITHNGVDTHPLHFHLFDVQVLNRVGWDGFVRLPWPNELGWKETVRVSPLEDTIVAMRPKAPPVPFPLQDSRRLKNPAYPDNAAVTDGFMNLDPLTGQAKVPADNNAGLYNYGAEYVWHCHILSHEEQDMMRPLVLRVATGVPADPTALTATAGFQKNSLSWTDNSYNGTVANPYNMTLGFYIERCNGKCNSTTGTFTRIAEMSMISSTNPTYIDDTVTSGSIYTYRVIGYNRYTTNGSANNAWVDGLTNPLAQTAPAYSGNVTSLSWQPASTMALTTDFASPHAGPVKFIALAGGTNVQPQYRFSVNGTVVQDYSVLRYWVMPATTNPSTVFTVNVDARTNYASTTPDISQSIPYTLQPTIDITPPITTAIPPAGAFLNPVQVYLQVNEPGSVIKYTIDGSDPVTSATTQIYTLPINISATTTLKYYSIDPAGNPEVVQSGIYELRPISLNPTVAINSGATVTNNLNVTLTIAATGATKMRFSNDDNIYSGDETFGPSKAWPLAAGADGVRTVYVRFTDTNGVLHVPAIAQIMYDTIPPVTTPFPTPGIYLGTTNVSLTANDTLSVIKYSIDGSDPTSSVTAQTYSTPISISTTSVLRYSATDQAGNIETPKTANYEIHVDDITVNTFTINGGAALTKNPIVTLNISAFDPFGVTKMRFSNDGVNYTADEPYATTKNNWDLLAGDGIKVVYVRFTDGNGFLYAPVTTQIRLDTTPPVTAEFPQPAGIYVNPINVTLTANEPGSVIKYTIDSSDPITSSSVLIYNGSITMNTSTILKYFSTDPAGNSEAVNSVTYTFNPATIAASIAINYGMATTNDKNVTVNVSANGATNMQFSNDGINYGNVMPYAAGATTWVLDPADGNKSVFARFTNSTGNLLNVASAQIILDTINPQTLVNPAPGVYNSPFSVSLAANEPVNFIKYTTNGDDPATSAAAVIYNPNNPVNVSATMTLKYFAQDVAGNSETVKSGTYIIHTGDLSVNTFKINGGAVATNDALVTMTINATDEYGVTKMRFSFDGTTYSQDEQYATSKTLTLSNGDGAKSVYARFTDGAGRLYDAVIAQIILDTIAPVTSANPPSETNSLTPISVVLTANGTGSGIASIRYTFDGSDPLTSTSAVTYASAIQIASNTELTIRYYATDLAGNKEAVRTATYKVTHPGDLTASVSINSGETVTVKPEVILKLSATDETGVAAMQFSNDGITYSAFETYPATPATKAWTLTPGEGLKTVYVKFKDNSGNIYDPKTAQVTLAFKNGMLPGTTSQLASAMKALQIAKGNIVATPADIAHADVAPFVNGAPKPDGKIDLGDVYVLLLNLVGVLGF